MPSTSHLILIFGERTKPKTPDHALAARSIMPFALETISFKEGLYVACCRLVSSSRIRACSHVGFLPDPVGPSLAFLAPVTHRPLAEQSSSQRRQRQSTQSASAAARTTNILPEMHVAIHHERSHQGLFDEAELPLKIWADAFVWYFE